MKLSDKLLCKEDPRLFINNMFPIEIFRECSLSNINRDFIADASPTFKLFKAIWDYLHELSKCSEFTNEHLELFSGFYTRTFAELSCLYRKDAQDILKKYIPNSHITYATGTGFSKAYLELPPVIYDFVKWSWVVSVYELLKNNKAWDFIKDRNTYRTFLYDVPSDYFKDDLDISRLNVEMLMLKYIYKLGWMLENKYTDVYALLNIGLDIEYVPDLEFGKDPIVETSNHKVSIIRPLHVDSGYNRYSGYISSVYNYITQTKVGCVNFLTEFRDTPTNILKTRLKDDLER